MRRALCLAAICVTGAIAGCGGDDSDSAGDAFRAVEQQEAERSAQAREIAAPRWEPLKTLEGSGDAAETVEIDDEAIRWRASWTCGAGKFELTANGREFGSENCPGNGRWSSIDTGEFELRVTATGPWRLTIYQQVESPLREPPARGDRLRRRRALAEGKLLRIENRGQGRARLYRLPNGRLALRMEGFSTAANTDLFVWISENLAPGPRSRR